MKNSKLRRQIAWEAARLMYERQESEYYRAKMKAAQRLCQGWAKPADLPSNSEIRDQVQLLARLFEGEERTKKLQQMRLAAFAVNATSLAFPPETDRQRAHRSTSARAPTSTCMSSPTQSRP